MSITTLPLELIEEIVRHCELPNILLLSQLNHDFLNHFSPNMWESIFKSRFNVIPSSVDWAEAQNRFSLRVGTKYDVEQQYRLRYCAWKEVYRVYYHRTTWSRELLHQLSPTQTLTARLLQSLGRNLPDLTRPEMYSSEARSCQRQNLDECCVSPLSEEDCQKQLCITTPVVLGDRFYPSLKKHRFLTWCFQDSRFSSGLCTGHGTYTLEICEEKQLVLGHHNHGIDCYGMMPPYHWVDRGENDFARTRNILASFVDLWRVLINQTYQGCRYLYNDLGPGPRPARKDMNAATEVEKQFDDWKTVLPVCRQLYMDMLEREMTSMAQSFCDSLRGVPTTTQIEISEWLYHYGAQEHSTQRRGLTTVRGSIERCTHRLCNVVLLEELRNKPEFASRVLYEGIDTVVYDLPKFDCQLHHPRGVYLEQSLTPSLEFRLSHLEACLNTSHLPRRYLSLRHLRLALLLQRIYFVKIAAEIQSVFSVSDLDCWLSDLTRVEELRQRLLQEGLCSNIPQV